MDKKDIKAICDELKEDGFDDDFCDLVKTFSESLPEDEDIDAEFFIENSDNGGDDNDE